MSQQIVISGLSELPGGAPDAENHFSRLPFKTRSDLGKKGTRNMDRLTALAIGGMAGLMSDLRVDRRTPKEDIGIVLGSAQGSIDSIVRFTHETLAYERPDFVNPALFPNTVMNCAAGQAAIWYQLRGLNTTISCQETSFLSALEYSCLQLQRGAARTLITGGVEELSEVSEAGHRAIAHDLDAMPRFKEHSMFVALETDTEAAAQDRRIVACIGGVATGFNPEPSDAEPLAALIRGVLETAETAASDIAAAVTSGLWSAQCTSEHDAVTAVLGDTCVPVAAYDRFGNAGSAHNALQLTLLLDLLSSGETGLVVAQDRAGNMAALVLTKGEHA